MPGQQRVIKKYANRKLYDMQDRKYVTQTLVQAMADAGDNVVVIDKETGAEITATVVHRAAHHQQPHHAQPHRVKTAHALQKKSAGNVTVRDQVANLVKASLTLPLEIGQLARDRLQERGVSAADIERLSARVAELEAEMAVLRDVLTSDDIKLVRN